MVTHTIEFTCDSYNFQKELFYPIIFMYFQFYPLCFYDFWHILISYWVHFFFQIIFIFHALCLYLLHKLTPVYHTSTYTMMYCVCHLGKIYIYWDIYISINFYCTMHFTSCSYCHPKTILECTTDICHEMGQYDICSVTSCLFLAICILSHNQISGVQHHLFHYESCT